ncbi:MAG: CHASE domain-containing protein [Prolixibacteraceae bacterium]
MIKKIQFKNRFHVSGNTWKSLVVLLFGLILTVLIAVYTGNQVEIQLKQEYVSVCNEIKIKISTQLNAQAQLLRAGSALFAASDTVTRKKWKDFSECLKFENYLPGIQGIGYSMIISKQDLKQHVETVRKEGFPDYSVRPSGDRPVYTSIIFLEPFSGRNLRAFGYDMFSEKTRSRAMEMSRDSDAAVLSGKVTLVQETAENVQIGTLMYVPVYRHGMPVKTVDQRRLAIKGWVYNPYRMDDLMHGILDRWELDKQKRIHLEIFDDSLSYRSKLYNSQKNDTINHSDSPNRTVSLPVEFYGKKWILLFTQSQEQNSALNGMVLIVLASGLLISFLLFALFLSLFNTQAQAMQIAENLTSELKASGERFKILLNSTAEAIYGIDLNGDCTFSNQACHSILGYENEGQLIGKNMHDLIHHSSADGVKMDVEDCLIYRSFMNGEGTHVDDEVLWRADGTSFPSEYWSFPIFINGQIEGSVVTFFDISERRKAEERINEAKLEAEQANHAKSEFLSRMSHEFRTPLNSILGFAQLLEMGELSIAHKKGVHYILNSGKHLLTLINEVLDIAKIESGHILIFPEPVHLSRLAAEMMDIVQPLANDKNIKLVYNSPEDYRIFVNTDRIKLKQVWLNLLNNAIKYNRPGGSVIIKTDIILNSVAGEEFVRVSFIDNGFGISKDDIQKLFIPFERIGAEKTESEGTGLGLAVVKKLMDAMGAKFGVDSRLDEGSTFWIELPRIESQQKRLEELSNNNGIEYNCAQKTGTILYIEDKLSNIELVEEILGNHRPGIRIIKSMLGKQAVNLAMDYAPNLILLDLDLPDIHGSIVFENLQNEIKTKDMPVVVVSADAMTQQIDKMLKAGVKGYITKPIDIVEFIKTVDAWI